MDLGRYRTAGVELVPWPGTDQLVGLAPLATADLDEARWAAEALFRAHALPPEGAHFDLETQLWTLAAALRTPSPPWGPLHTAPELGELLGVAELQILYARWLEVQVANYPPKKAHKAMLRALADSSEMLMDAVRAQQAHDVASFYGRPAERLTPGQLSYWVLIRSAYAELYGEASAGKVVSRKWLESAN